MRYKDLFATIDICIADRGKRSRWEYSGIFDSNPLYKLIWVENARDASKALYAKKDCHVCIMDFGIGDQYFNEFSLLTRFAKRTSFIICSSEMTIEQSFVIRDYGVKAVVKKDSTHSVAKLKKLVKKAVLCNLFNPSYDFLIPHNVPGNITKTLFDTNPTSVSEWARNAGISESYLRRICKDCCKQSPKNALALHRKYSAAIDYYTTIKGRKRKSTAGEIDAVVYEQHDSVTKGKSSSKSG
ncbi:MAG: hypothetical protein GF401_11335 [Chitinivibrionales bacterium]|nr:hypothetical protein [Chitinivibrionales bacterium]